MTHHHLITIIALTASTALIAPPLSAQQAPLRYELVDLLRAGESGFETGSAYSVNNNGLIGGNVLDKETSLRRACYWEGSQLHLLDSEGVNKGRVRVEGINDNNAMVGAVSFNSGSRRALFWENPAAKVEILPGLIEGYDSVGFDINDLGQISGNSSIGNGESRGVVWQNGAIIHQLDPLPGFSTSAAQGISSQGEVVGVSYGLFSPPATATMWINGETLKLPPLEGQLRSDAWCINDRGFSAGVSRTSWEDIVPVIWDRNQVPHPLSSTGRIWEVSGINNRNQVVGAAYTQDREYIARVWSEGKEYILNDHVINLPKGVSLTRAFQINDAGVIAAVAYDSAQDRGLACALIPIHLTLTGPTPNIAGQLNQIQITNATSGAKLIFAFSLEPGLTTLPTATTKCGGKGLSLNNPQFVGSATADAQGNATFNHYVPPTLQNRTVYIQVIERGSCKLSNRIEPTFK